MKVTGWDNGLCQDYDKGLGRWFANRLGARQQLRQDFKMTQLITVDRATLEQCLAATLGVVHGDAVFGKPVKEAISSLRAALANAEPAQQVPDMFWNHDDAETLYGSIEEFLNDEICNGTPLEVGDVRVIQRAVSMPKIQVRITAVHDEECEADYVEEPYVKAAP